MRGLFSKDYIFVFSHTTVQGFWDLFEMIW